MNPWLDPLFYEVVVRAHQQELLESARADRALMAAQPRGIARMLAAIGRRFGWRVTSARSSPAPEPVTHGSCHGHALCERFRTRKDAA